MLEGQLFQRRGVATALGELPARCNSHWRLRVEKIVIRTGDFVLINTKASFSCVLTITTNIFSCVLEITNSFETKNSFLFQLCMLTISGFEFFECTRSFEFSECLGIYPYKVLNLFA